MMEAANDTRPLQPLTFLAAAIRAEVADLRMLDTRKEKWAPQLARIEQLVAEIERHAEGARPPVHVTEGEKTNA